MVYDLMKMFLILFYWSEYNSELIVLLVIFCKNLYLEPFIDKHFTRVLNNTQLLKQSTPTAQKKHVRVLTTPRGPRNQKFYTYTNADLKISLYVCVHIKKLPWKFRILNPKNSRVICL